MIEASFAVGDNRLSALADDLLEKGWSRQAGLFPAGLIAALRADLLALQADDALTPAGIGREDDHAVDRSVRRTRIVWLDAESPVQRAFLEAAETLRNALNQRLFLGLFEFEAHYAIYPPGGFYERHVDSFRGARNRVVSLVVYLNEAWDEADGGALAIFAPEAGEGADPVAVLAPVGGDAVLMMSEDIPHAVLPTRVQRLSIAGWWRVNQSDAGRVDPLA